MTVSRNSLRGLRLSNSNLTKQAFNLILHFNEKKLPNIKKVYLGGLYLEVLLKYLSRQQKRFEIIHEKGTIHLSIIILGIFVLQIDCGLVHKDSLIKVILSF